MTETKKENLHKFLIALPLGLIAILAICLLFGGSLLFVYSIVIAFAWKSAMAFCAVFAGSMLALGTGFGSIVGFRAYLKDFNNKVNTVIEPKPKTQVPKKRIFTFTNFALAVMLLGSILAIVSALLGSIERDNWVKARASYMTENGYYTDFKKFDIQFVIPANNSKIVGDETLTQNLTIIQNSSSDHNKVPTQNSTPAHDLIPTKQLMTLSIELKNKNAVVIYEDKISDHIRLVYYGSFENQIEATVGAVGTPNDGKLTIFETSSKKLNRVVDKMLFFVFRETEVQKQIRIYIPKFYEGKIAITGEHIVAK